MKAVILAGGLGTRLRPLTLSRPKVLFPVVNRPLLDRTLAALAAAGFDEAVLCVNYLADLVVGRYGGEAFGLRVSYAVEAKPLGTGGAVAHARRFLGGGPFVVLNGDILAAVDFGALLAAHGASERLATVVVRPVADPGPFGAVELEERRVRRFMEKPPPGKAPSNLVNAGIYVLEPEVLDLLPPGAPASLEHDLFPALARAGRLFAEPYGGPWYDIGTLEDYRRCNREVLRREAAGAPRGVLVGEDVRLGNGVLKGPAALGAGATVERSTVVGPGTIVGEASAIGMGARVEDSVLLEAVAVGEHGRLSGAVVGGGAQLGRYARLDPGVAVGDGARVAEHALLAVDVKVSPGRSVDASVLLPGVVV